jgi:hypothetical protein
MHNITKICYMPQNTEKKRIENKQIVIPDLKFASRMSLSSVVRPAW